MKATVIIPTRNGAHYLQETLPSILEQDMPCESYEVVVVDNDSDDDTPTVLDALRRRYPHLRLGHEAVRGPGAARNCGIYMARNDLFVFLDDDIRVQPNHVRRHVEYHEQSNAVLCVVNAVANRSSSDWPPLDAYLKQGPVVASRSATGGHDGLALVSQDFSLRRGALERVRFEAGGRVQYFDESFVMRQDGELGIRLEKAGLLFRFVSDIPAQHVQTYTKAQMAARSFKAGYYTYILFARHPDVNAPVPFRRFRSPMAQRSLLVVGQALIALGRVVPGVGPRLTQKGVGVWLTFHLNRGYEAAAAEAHVAE